MTDIEAIQIRRSRRSFLSKLIEQEKIKQLNNIIAEINKESGLRITFIEDGTSIFAGLKKSYGLFKNVRSVIAFIGKASDPNLKEKIGYYGEKVILEATKLGLGTCWVGATFDKNDPAFNLAGDEEIICTSPLGYPTENKGLIEKLAHSITHRKTKSIEDMSQSDTSKSDWFIKAMQAVLLAPSARHSQKSKFILQDGKVSASIPDDYFFDLVDLGIAKLHFEIAAEGKFDIGNNAKFNK